MSTISPVQQAAPPTPSATLRKTVAVVDMVGYSTIAKLLEENISATSVSDLNRQIQTFISRALAQLPDQKTFCVVARTGDGIIVLFERADDAHHFARHVHLFAREHNEQRSESTAQRWFRIGIATGEVSETACTDRPNEYAGTAIANAVRLEAAAHPGEILLDTASFALLSPALQRLYPPEETVRGKRHERFRAHRLSVTRRPRRTLTHPALSRRTFLTASAATIAAASLGVWFDRPLFENWTHPLPIKRFVALLGWPPPKDPDTRPMLMGLMDVIVTELARAEVFDSNLFLTSQGTAADLTTIAQLDEAQTSLGANLILATSLSKSAGGTEVLLQLLPSPASAPLRARTITFRNGEHDALSRHVVSAAADLLHISHYLPDLQHIRAGTTNPEAYAFFQQAETLVQQPNDTGLNAAINKYQQATAADMRYAAAHAKLAIALCRLYFVHLDPAALDLARANALAALQLDSQSVDAHLALATILSRTGDPQGAFQEFASGLAIDPSNPRILIEQAQLYASLNRWDRAEDTFQRLIRIRPNLWLAHFELGVVFGQQGKYKSALSEFRAAATAKPSEAISFTNIGAVLLLRGEIAEAIESLRHSLELKQTADAASNLAAAFRVQHNLATSVEFALRSVAISPADPLNWLELGDCYASNQATQGKAREAYRRADKTQRLQLETEPRNGPGWMIAALTALKLDGSANPRPMIAKAEALGANDLDSQLYKVRILELLGERAKAIETASLCISRGAEPFQFVLSPDLEGLRDDPLFKQSATAARPTIAAEAAWEPNHAQG